MSFPQSLFVVVVIVVVVAPHCHLCSSQRHASTNLAFFNLFLGFDICSAETLCHYQAAMFQFKERA